MTLSVRQTWSDLLFVHWPLTADPLRRALPQSALADLLDAFGGSAWITITPLYMSGVGIRGLPGVPGASAFPELNVRTYVTIDGRPGVAFLSLDAGSRLACAAARLAYRLPYFHARMTAREDGGWIAFSSRRVERGAPPAEFRARYRPVGEGRRSEPGSLAHWLTERYSLYTADSRGRLFRADVEHEPWSLQPAELQIDVNTMAQAHGIELPSLAPIVQFARRLEVIAAPLRRVR